MIRISAIRRPEWRKIEVAIVDVSTSGKVSVASQITFTEVEEGAYLSNGSTLSLDFDAATRLMDDLWGCGVRPTDQRDRSGEVGAMKEHIVDLRKVLDRYLGAE